MSCTMYMSKDQQSSTWDSRIRCNKAVHCFERPAALRFLRCSFYLLHFLFFGQMNAVSMNKVHSSADLSPRACFFAHFFTQKVRSLARLSIGSHKRLQQIFTISRDPAVAFCVCWLPRQSTTAGMPHWRSASSVTITRCFVVHFLYITTLSQTNKILETHAHLFSLWYVKLIYIVALFCPSHSLVFSFLHACCCLTQWMYDITTCTST